MLCGLWSAMAALRVEENLLFSDILRTNVAAAKLTLASQISCATEIANPTGNLFFNESGT